jgi:hypothetical protein
LEPKTLVWNRASGAQRNACRGTDEGSGGVAQGRQPEKAHDEGAQHFFRLPLVIPLRTPRQAQEAATQGTPISPSVFIALDVRWAKMLYIPLKLDDRS